MYKGSNTYHINSVETIEMFYNLRTDLDKLNCATKVCKIVRDVTYENQNSFNILQLLLNTLYVISETSKDLDLVLSIFKLRILSILGFKPKINECVKCKEQENISYFSIENNGFLCEKCGKQDKSAIQISDSTVNAIKYTLQAPPKKLYSFDLKDASLKEFVLVAKLYFEKKLQEN